MSAGNEHAVFRWRLWRRVFGYHLLPPRHALDAQIAELDALGRRLWRDAVRPHLAAEFGRLVADEPDEEHRELARDLRRIAANGYLFAELLYRMHGADAAAAEQIGQIAMWLGMAASNIDYLVDEQQASVAELAAILSPEAVHAALTGSPGAAALAAPGDAPPHLRFLVTCLEHAFAGIRARASAAPRSAHRDRIQYEIEASVHRLVAAELASPGLRLCAATPLAEVEDTLRVVNTMSLWLFAYVGLLGEPRPGDAVLDGLRRVTGAVGEIVWSLDALADIHQDLERGVYSLVWLTLAREMAPHDGWLTPGGVDRGQALARLAQHPVLERMLGRVEVLLLQLERETALPPEPLARLGRLCRMLVWGWLAPPLPEPEDLEAVAP